MSAYIHSGGHLNPGLIKRRNAETALIIRRDEQQQAAANGIQRFVRLIALFQARSQ
jgi:hypothetical protein